jgi:hypothetical protein
MQDCGVLGANALDPVPWPRRESVGELRWCQRPVAEVEGSPAEVVEILGDGGGELRRRHDSIDQLRGGLETGDLFVEWPSAGETGIQDRHEAAGVSS